MPIEVTIPKNANSGAEIITTVPVITPVVTTPNQKPDINQTVDNPLATNKLSTISVTNKLSDGITTPLSIGQPNTPTSNQSSPPISQADFNKLFESSDKKTADPAVIVLPTLSATNSLLNGISYPLAFKNGSPNVNEENARGNQIFSLKVVKDPANPSLYTVDLKDFVASTKFNTEAEIMKFFNKPGTLRIDSTNLPVGVKFVNEGGNNPKLVIDTNPVMVSPTNLSASYNTADREKGAYFGLNWSLSFGGKEPEKSNFSIKAGRNEFGVGLNVENPIKLEGNINSVQVSVPNKDIITEFLKKIGIEPKQNKPKL